MGGSISGGNVTAAAEFNIYNDPEAARIVFAAGWPVTMVGLEIGNRTVFTPAHLAELSRSHGKQNDFAVAVLKHLINLSASFGFEGTPLYDPTAIGVAIDRTLVSTQRMRVDVETRGEFTRGETVGNRHNAIERHVRQGDRNVIVGLEKVEPNTDVCLDVDAERFLKVFIARLQGR